MRAVRSAFGFGCSRGGSRIGLVIVVGKHGCWPPEDYFALGSRYAAPVFSRNDSLLIPCLGLVQGGSPQSGYLGHRCCGRRKRCNLARILAASTPCQLRAVDRGPTLIVEYQRALSERQPTVDSSAPISVSAVAMFLFPSGEAKLEPCWS